MKDFPDFMKNEKNHVHGSMQNTEDIEGYYYERGGKRPDGFLDLLFRQGVKKHKHDFDEYTIIVSGQYTACF